MCVCHPPSGAEGGGSGVTHPFLPQGCAALALPHSLLLYLAGNVGRVEEVMSVLRGVESIDEGVADVDGQTCTVTVRGEKNGGDNC